TEASAPPLEDCLRLLRGERDEQKLAGLLIAANVCRAGDAAAVAQVYRAVGPRFLRRLLNTGLGKVEGGKEEEREAYLRLAVTVLAGLARAPEVAADAGVVSTVPISSEKLQALLLAECMMSILGENWLSEDHKILDNKNAISVDKFVLLVLQSARVEVAVLLNELAFSKYESSKSSQTDDAIIQKQRNLAILFSLIERIIKMISDASSGEGEPSQTICEKTIMQVITGLNETISLVLDFLQDAKDHGQRKGDDLLAAVRIVGSYLAETPYACQEKTGHLLEFIFSIEGQDESSPFYSVRFMLPMLSQITTTADGCRTLVSFGGYKAVIDCLIKMTEENGMMIDDGSMFLACDTIINIMSNRKNYPIQMEPCFIRLLQALITWAVSVAN
uniref:Neurochondrin n=1 Tax=Aegilops tauschii subsp. strangulata TaxID=200361 RepID=A0A453PXC7_AEGTS